VSIYLSAATAQKAAETIAGHCDDGEGWCSFCLRHFRVRIRHGECLAYLYAARARAVYRQQQELPSSRPVGGGAGPFGFLSRKPNTGSGAVARTRSTAPDP
jgi:hypothetical protein